MPAQGRGGLRSMEPGPAVPPWARTRLLREGGRGCVGECRQQEGSLRRTIEGNGGTGKRPSGSTVSTDGLVWSSMIHGKKALSALQRARSSVPGPCQQIIWC